jgi:hypothetical protein
MARLEEKKINRSSLAPYGESVKRHLESFDLEASLNEVCTHSTFHRYPANCPRWLMVPDASPNSPKPTANERMIISA